MTSLFQLPKASPVSAGSSYASCKCHFYQAGTTTNITTYTTSALSTPHANPVVADANGVFAPIFIDEGTNTTYKMRLVTSADALIYEIDNIPAIPSQANIGAALWPRTAAEIAAAVTPTYYYYEPGDVRRYGAVVNGSTDDSGAWSSANLQGANGGVPIFVPRSSAGMGTASALVADYRCDVVFEAGAFIKYTGSGNITILTIGGTSANPGSGRRYERLYVTRTNQSDWSSEAAIAIKCLCISNSYIEIVQASNCTIGVQTLPSGGGFAYNKIDLGYLLNNKFCVDISNVSSGSANENNWHGGRFTVNTGVNTAIARYGVRITSSDGSYVSNNNNHFWKPSFELNASNASAEAVPILMTHGVNNYFYGCRDEDNDTPFAREANASGENLYDVGYSTYAGQPTIDGASTSPSWVRHSARLRVFDSPLRLVFDSGPMHKRACYYDGGTTVHVPNVSLISSADATVYTNLSSITFNANYLDSTRGFSVFINTTDCKQFVVARDCESGRGGRLIVHCYDSAGVLITTAGSVKGTLLSAISFTASYGGAFQTGSDSNNDTCFTVTDAVKSVRASIGEGSASLRIRSFMVFSVNYHAHCWSWPGYAEAHPGQNIGSAAPTSGTWELGRMVWNAVPAAGGTPGWVCTTAGTPGTWKAMANVAA